MKHKKLVDKILEHSGDAIIVISMDGVILSANPEALDLLEFSEEELVGKSYYWFFFNQTKNQKLGEKINDGFHKSIEHAMDDGSYVTPAGVEKTLKISTALLKDKSALGTLAAKESLVVFMKKVEDDLAIEPSQSGEYQAAEIMRLKKELAQSTVANKQLSVLFKKFDFLKIFAILAVFAVFASVMIFSKRNVKLFPETVGVSTNQEIDGIIVTAKLDTMEKNILLTGIIEPYSKVTIAAQTAGRVVRRRFREGDFVEKEEILYAMDTHDLAKNVRSARITFIELQDEYSKLAGWDSSLAVMQAKRKFQLSKIALDNERKKLEETKKLFDKGIIPRIEYEKEETGFKKAEFDYENARQGLDSEMEKGSAGNLEVKKLKLDNAKEELDEIEARYEAKLIRSPVSGIIMKPELKDGKVGEFKNDGDTVNDGDPVATIGATQTYLINSIIGELNVKELKTGEPVAITGPAFTGIEIAGEVNWTASTAEVRNGHKYYPVRISFSNIPDSLRRDIRIGMRAEVSLLAERLEDVVTVPIQAISFDNNSEKLFIVTEEEEYEEREVTVGFSDSKKIQIVEGVEPGERVLINVPVL
jgi:HlyD family secretion protein